MRHRITFGLSLALLGIFAVTGVVLATGSSGITSPWSVTGSLDPINLNVKTDDWKVQLHTKGESDVTVVENHVAPGGTFGWHSHPGPSIIVVRSGTITFYHSDDPTCTPHRYTAGQALVDTGNDVHVGRNEGTDEVVVLVTRIIPKGAAPRIDQPAPGNCPF